MREEILTTNGTVILKGKEKTEKQEEPKDKKSGSSTISETEDNTEQKSKPTPLGVGETQRLDDKEKSKKIKKERIGILNIYTTFNNTIINLTDMSGKSIAKFSGGQSTKQDRLKANPTIAMFIAQKIAEEAQDNGITGFYVKIRAKTGQTNPGPGVHSAIKSLTRAGFKILSIIEKTRIPRGGPKKPYGRKGRRV